MLTITIPYSGKLWRQKTLVNLANCFRIRQSLTLQLLQHTGSIANNACDCNTVYSTKFWEGKTGFGEFGKSKLFRQCFTPPNPIF